MSETMGDAVLHPVGGDARRWAASLAMVLAVHAAGGAGLLAWRLPAESPPPPSAVMIDLAPLPTPPAPEPAAAQPPPPAPEPPPEPEPEPEPLPILPPPPVPVPVPEVAVPVPPPKAKPRQPAPKKVELRPPVPDAVPAAVAPAAAPASAPAPAAPAAPSGAVRSWQGDVMAHLEQHKRYPRAARMRGQGGIVQVRFVIDRLGKVLSYSLEKGSGVAVLDEETLAMIERADPLPAPPEPAPARVELVVPVVYAIK